MLHDVVYICVLNFHLIILLIIILFYLGRSDREHIKIMHHLHRSSYMNERLHYYQRRHKAESQPGQYCSFIMDGMQQQHCLLPWYGHVANFPEHLPQHIQGVLSHGRFVNMYRTYHHVFNGANLQIHTFLDSLQQVLDNEEKIPETLFVQIDGGSENTAKAMLGICELLIARGK